MAIKKVKFTIPKSSFSYTALGGVRFYKSQTELILSGAQISSGTTSGETQNFIATSTAGYSSSTNYNLPYLFDTNKKQTGTFTDLCYWLTNDTASVYTIALEFKVAIDFIYKIEIVPRPDSGYTDRGIDKPITIELIDENNLVRGTYNITPITQINTVQTISMFYSKILLSSNNNFYSASGPNLTPTQIVLGMTSNTSGTIGVASASSELSPYQAWKAFNGTTADAYDAWINSGSANPTGWLQYKFNTTRILAKYGVVVRNDANRGNPKNWTFEGSNNGTSWTILDTQAEIVNWSLNTPKYFTIKNPASFTYYRINITAITNVGAAPYISIGELTFFEVENSEPFFIRLDTSTARDFNNYGLNIMNFSKPFTTFKDICSISNILNTGKTYVHTIDMSKRKINKVTLG